MCAVYLLSYEAREEKHKPFFHNGSLQDPGPNKKQSSIPFVSIVVDFFGVTFSGPWYRFG